MSLFFMALMSVYLFKKSKKLNQKQFVFLGIWILIALVGLIAYNEFLVSKGWKLGIPGADMGFYYQAAKSLQLGASWDDLANISTLYFSEISIGTIAYFLFAQFLSLLLEFPVFGEQLSLYFIYAMFLMLGAVCAIDIADFLKEFNSGKLSTTPFVVALTCVAVPVAAYRLLRDILIYYFIVETFCYIQKKRKLIVEILLILLCMLFRSYSLVLIFPYFLYKHSGKKITTIVCISFTVFMTASLGVLEFLKRFFVVPWEFGNFNINEVFKFLMFPNIFNQSSIIMHWQDHFGNSTFLGGANLPGVYYLMSVWNIVVLGLFVFGIIYKFREKLCEKVVWLSAMLNIGIVYSLLYNSETTETRQKLMIVIPLVYFALEGWKFLESIKISAEGRVVSGAITYSGIMLFIILFILFVGAL